MMLVFSLWYMHLAEVFSCAAKLKTSPTPAREVVTFSRKPRNTAKPSTLGPGIVASMAQAAGGSEDVVWTVDAFAVTVAGFF